MLEPTECVSTPTTRFKKVTVFPESLKEREKERGVTISMPWRERSAGAGAASRRQQGTVSNQLRQPQLQPQSRPLPRPPSSRSLRLVVLVGVFVCLLLHRLVQFWHILDEREQDEQALEDSLFSLPRQSPPATKATATVTTTPRSSIPPTTRPAPAPRGESPALAQQDHDFTTTILQSDMNDTNHHTLAAKVTATASLSSFSSTERTTFESPQTAPSAAAPAPPSRSGQLPDDSDDTVCLWTPTHPTRTTNTTNNTTRNNSTLTTITTTTWPSPHMARLYTCGYDKTRLLRLVFPEEFATIPIDTSLVEFRIPPSFWTRLAAARQPTETGTTTHHTTTNTSRSSNETEADVYTWLRGLAVPHATVHDVLVLGSNGYCFHSGRGGRAFGTARFDQLFPGTIVHWNGESYGVRGLEEHVHQWQDHLLQQQQRRQEQHQGELLPQEPHGRSLNNDDNNTRSLPESSSQSSPPVPAAASSFEFRRSLHVGYLADSPWSVQITFAAQTVVEAPARMQEWLWNPALKPRTTGQAFLIYTHGNCVPYREQALLDIAEAVQQPVDYGGLCRGTQHHYASWWHKQQRHQHQNHQQPPPQDHITAPISPPRHSKHEYDTLAQTWVQPAQYPPKKDAGRWMTNYQSYRNYRFCLVLENTA